RVARYARPGGAQRPDAARSRAVCRATLPRVAPARRGELAVDRSGDSTRRAGMGRDPRPSSACCGTVEYKDPDKRAETIEERLRTGGGNRPHALRDADAVVARSRRVHRAVREHY